MRKLSRERQENDKRELRTGAGVKKYRVKNYQNHSKTRKENKSVPCTLLYLPLADSYVCRGSKSRSGDPIRPTGMATGRPAVREGQPKGRHLARVPVCTAQNSADSPHGITCARSGKWDGFESCNKSVGTRGKKKRK